MIELENGKYQFFWKDNMLYCNRYGQPWRDFCGDNAVYFLFLECEKLKKALEQAHDNLENSQ